ncbi:MAG TPA: hemerythrin domain-containing protein [Candidatus Baltobacteraceae bacterium]|nr:hemerythrin domain-containing protein [Candidatus Baltobacteraceae bacterium]
MHERGERAGAPADYDLLERQAASLLEEVDNFLANAANFAAFVYHSLPDVNWAGFYFPDDRGLILGPFGGKPACTRLPKGKGVCNRSFETAKPVIVEDVNAFTGHIACDPASRSELVVPVLNGPAVYGVFDIDSPIKARFTDRDAAGVQRLVAQFVAHTPLPERYRTVRSVSHINERIDVQTCRDHHTVLRYLVEEVGKEQHPAAIAPLLRRLRTVLIAHLKLEDDWLYPRLAQSANGIVRGKADRYRREMGGLRKHFEDLWAQWSPEGAVAADFQTWQQQWHEFRDAIELRITTEDDDLYVAAEADIT